MSISNHLNKIKNAVFGKDVRGAIHDAIKQCYDDASINHDNANMEVKIARGTHDTLNDRLNKSDKTLAETNAQLSKKANANEVVKKGYGTLNDFDEETRRAIQGMGGTEINAVLGDKNVQTENLADRSVTVDKCAFNPVVGKITNNLIQIDTMLEGYYIQHQNGSEAINIEYSVTDFIHALPNQKYTLSHRDQLAFYDGEKNYIGGIDNGGEEGIYQTFTFETPNNAKYIRISVKTCYKYCVQMKLGEFISSYTPGGVLVEKYKLDREILNDLAEIENKISYEYSDNLFNKATITPNCYVRGTTGEIVEKEGYSISDFIAIKPNFNYVINFYEQIAFYDSCKNYIGGEGGSELLNKVVLTPVLASYIRVTVKNSRINTYQIEEGEVITSYKSFAKKIDHEIRNEMLQGIFRKSKNLFDSKQILIGKYISFVDGNLRMNESFVASDYIAIEPCEYYSINYYHQVAFYDENKLFISGVDGYELENQTILSPNNAKYIRATVALNKLNIYQLEKGQSVTSYESYGQKVTDEFIDSILIASSGARYKSVRSVFKKLAQSLVTNEKITIKLIGDSITHGVGGTGWAQTGEVIYGNFRVNENGYCWANLFKEYMESKFNCEILNFGTTGRNSTDLLNNINAIVRDEDDIVICMIGTNDRNNESRDIVLNSKNVLYKNLLNIYEVLTKRGKEVIFMSNIPASIENENSDKLFHMEDVDHVISCVASTLNCEYISVYRLFIEYCQTRNITIDSLLADGLHPNDKGYDVMFYLISNALGFGTKRDGANWI